MGEIWGPEVVPPRNVLRGLALAGSCTARRPTSQRLRSGSRSDGWAGTAGVHFHSHQTGVRPDLRSSGIGFALKMAQRDICRQHGIDEMRWTYDPLLAANAAFNLGRLGARPIVVPPELLRREGGCVQHRRHDRPARGVLAASTRALGREPGRDRRVRPVAGVGIARAAPLRRSTRSPARRSRSRRATTSSASRIPVVAAAWRIAVASALADTFAAGLGIVGFRANGYLIGEALMRIDAIEIVRVSMPLVRPFRTSFGTQHHREVLLVHVLTDVGRRMGRGRGAR